MKNIAVLMPLSTGAPTISGEALLSGDVLALIADSVICADESGRILFFNKAAEHAFGYRDSEVIGQHVEMLLPQRHRTAHAIEVRSFASGEGTASRLMGHRREVCGRQKNGKEFPAEAAVSRESVNGSTVLTVIVRDITERKALEKEREANCKRAGPSHQKRFFGGQFPCLPDR